MPGRPSAHLRLVGEPVLLHEYRDLFQADDGQAYVVRTYGQGRTDGTWIGWLVFVAADGRRGLRTGQQTTQSSREQAAYWATGLQPTYIAGPFRRAA